MANNPTGYGYSREMKAKRDGAYDENLEAKLGPWLAGKTGICFNGSGKDYFANYLMDGKVLQKLCETYSKKNDLLSYSVVPVDINSKSGMQIAKRNENIGNFLKAYESLHNWAVENCGRSKLAFTTFQTISLIEQKDLNEVQNGISGFLNLISFLKYDDIPIATKESAKNARDFDEATRRAGQNVIGLQMGTNQVASQKGMTGYGQGRQIIHKTN